MDDFLNKKRKAQLMKQSDNKNINKEELKQTDKPIDINEITNLKFIAKRKTSINDNNKSAKNTSDTINKMIAGDELNYEKRRIKAQNILSKLKTELTSKENNDIIEEINHIIEYDNTNNIILYECLEILSKLGLNDEYNKLLDDSKYCLTKKFYITKDNKKLLLNLSNLSSKNNDIFLFDDDKEILNEINTSFDYLDTTIKIYSKINANPDLKNQLKDLLTFETIKYKNGKYF